MEAICFETQTYLVLRQRGHQGLNQDASCFYLSITIVSFIVTMRNYYYDCEENILLQLQPVT